MKDIYYNVDEPGDIDPSNISDVDAWKQCLDARNKRKAAHAEETSLSSLLDGLMAFRMRSARQGKRNWQSTDPDLPRHDRVKTWLRLQLEGSRLDSE